MYLKDLYCTIYVNTDMGKPGLTILINDYLHGDLWMNEIESKFLSISVMKNKRIDSTKTPDTSDAFLNYPYYLDIDPADNVNRETFIQQLKSLINFLRKNGFKAQPVCDFEEELNEINNASLIL